MKFIQVDYKNLNFKNYYYLKYFLSCFFFYKYIYFFFLPKWDNLFLLDCFNFFKKLNLTFGKFNLSKFRCLFLIEKNLFLGNIFYLAASDFYNLLKGIDFLIQLNKFFVIIAAFIFQTNINFKLLNQKYKINTNSNNFLGDFSRIFIYKKVYLLNKLLKIFNNLFNLLFLYKNLKCPQ